MKKTITLFITSLFIIFIACKKDNDTPSSFKVKALLQSEVDNQILPGITSFINAVSNLETTVKLYLAETTEENLSIARQQWVATAIAYEKIYVFNIGDVRSKFIHFSIYDWPATPVAIENNILNNTIDKSFMDSVLPTAKSIAALEYLLFKTSLSETNLEISSSIKRKDYMKFSVEFLELQANNLQNTWVASGGNYSSTFINNENTGVRSSFNIFFNGLYNLIDTGKITKIGKPAGLEKSDVINPELTQAYFSNTSLAILSANMESITQAYFNTNGDLGIDDYVFFITQNNELNDLVLLRIKAVNDAIKAIPLTLNEAIIKQPELTKELHNKLEELRILFAVDLRSRLSIVITSTDNDGD